MLIVGALVLLLTGRLMPGESGIYTLIGAQALVLLSHILTKQVTGTGGFVFMSFLFFGMRPLFILLEDDKELFTRLFFVSVGTEELHENVFWATAGLLAFQIGSMVIRSQYAGTFQRRVKRESLKLELVSPQLIQMVLLYQFVSLPVMLFLARGGRAIYGSALGAYAYDFPVVLQAGHIFGFVVIWERYLQNRSQGNLFTVVLSAVMFLTVTYWMREVSQFRGFYIAGVMIIGIAALHRVWPRVGYVWLIAPIILLQPIFQYLGNTRYADNETLAEKGVLQEAFRDESVLSSYWQFYDSRGDMNIFDTFVAARASDPSVTPYFKSWIYAPFHVVPRKIWAGKPEKGVLQDLRFMNGAPYCPGIAGFFWLDGGSDAWMLFSMLLLGGVIGFLDGYVLSMRKSYLQACLMGVLVISSMFLTRFYLWQAFWQAMYAVVPMILMQKFLAPKPVLAGDEERAEEEDGDSEATRPVIGGSTHRGAIGEATRGKRRRLARLDAAEGR